MILLEVSCLSSHKSKIAKRISAQNACYIDNFACFDEREEEWCKWKA